MTIVELFDEKPINNVVGTLAFHPEKLIYVGGYAENEFAERMQPVLENYFLSKEFDIPQIEYVKVDRKSLIKSVAAFEKIYSENEDCQFHIEITGGEDLILVALGVLCQRHPEIKLCQISSRLRSIRQYSLLEDKSILLDISCENTVEQNLLLHGASIVYADGSKLLEDGYQWHWESLLDLDEMWNICCNGIGKEMSYGNSKPNLWNRATSLFGMLESADQLPDVLDRLVIRKSYYNGSFLEQNDTGLFQEYVYYFVRCGLLENQEFEGDYVTFIFKNPFVRMCLTTAGLVLELKTYQICKALVEQYGGDCMTGVTVDWDGDDDTGATVKFCYNPLNPSTKVDTMNEVDVMATRGLVPYFISCKNGKFEAEELYKLYSVGERLGRGYNKKIIVTTDMKHALGDNYARIKQRAVEMGIVIIENVHQMSDKEFSDKLAKAMELPVNVPV